MKLRNFLPEDAIDDRIERDRNSLENNSELEDDTASDLYNNSATGERAKPTSRPVGDYSNPFENTMKLTDIAQKALQEAESKAAEQAHHLGLTAAGYGNWKDESGEVVAKSVKGGDALIKTASEEEPEMGGEEEPEQEPTPDAIEEPEDLLAPDVPETPEDDYVPHPEYKKSAGVEYDDDGNPIEKAPELPPSDEPVTPVSNDVNRALSLLAKKYHDATGNPERQAAIKAQIAKVQAAEEAEKQHMIDALAKVQARKDAEKAAIRANMAKNKKYGHLLNNPNKDL